MVELCSSQDSDSDSDPEGNSILTQCCIQTGMYVYLDIKFKYLNEETFV